MIKVVNVKVMRKLGLTAMIALLLAAAVPAPAPALAADGRQLGLFSRRALVTGPADFRTWAFTDTADSRAQEEFVLLAALDIFRGSSGPGGPSRPADIVSRAEITAMVVRVLAQDDLAQRYRDERIAPPYDDAAAIPEWARGYAGAAAALGMVKGLPGPEKGIFAADQPVRFGDAVTIVARALRQDSGRQWPEEARAELDAALAARLEKDRGEHITREEMAILLVNALRTGRYNPDTGALDPALGLLHNPFFTYQGIVDEIRPAEGTLRLRREGDPTRPGAEVRYLARRVFLRGVTDPRDLVGRRITVVDAGPQGVVYIDAR